MHGKLVESAGKVVESADSGAAEWLGKGFLTTGHSVRVPEFLKSIFPRVSLFWKLNILFWVVLGSGMFLFRLWLHENNVKALIFTLLLEGYAVVACGVLRMVYQRNGHAFGLPTAWVMIVSSLAVTLMQTGLVAGFCLLTGWGNPLTHIAGPLGIRIALVWLVVMCWSLGYFWVWAEVEGERAEALKAEARREARRMELRMLRSQMDPHFLFNSLNGIAAEIRSHPAAAIELVIELSDYLRYSLAHRWKATDRLAAEMDAMNAYLRIQCARFRERLQYEITVQEPAQNRLVPVFLLQPLVENAVKHGLQSAPDRVEILVEGSLHEAMLCIRVTNSGKIEARPLGEASGLGLETLRRRLEIHYPGRHELRLECGDGNCVHAILELKGEPCCE